MHPLLQHCVVILAINWVTQGMRGMQLKELSFRLTLELILLLSVFGLLKSLGISVAFAFVVGAFGAHSFSYLFNGQFWVCARYCESYRRNPENLDLFLERVGTRLVATGWIEEAVCIGSQGRGQGTTTMRSDIDLRLLFGAGIVNWLRLNVLMLGLRTKAFLAGIPLDLYGYNDVSALDRFDQSEPLYIIKDAKKLIRARYRTRKLHIRL